MRDDPRQNLKWLEQELLAPERPANPEGISEDTADLLAQVDQLLAEEPEVPVFLQKNKKKRLSRGERAERNHIPTKFDESAAVLTKTKRQLRKEARKRKKENINRNIKGLVFLAVLELVGILAILGWWLQ